MTTLNQSSSGSTSIKAPEELQVTEDEAKWVEIQPFLLSAGYKLRSRYDPNWVPSWWSHNWRELQGENKGSQPEDAHEIWDWDVIDAIRIEDEKKVVMKWLAANSSEVRCIRYLSNISISDPRNRTIPVLQILPLPNDIDVLVIMPYGRRFNHPAFHCRGEFAEAMRQFLEGLTFMHEHNVCHFDIAPQNLMMDESRVVPRGSHFCYPKTHNGYGGYFEWENRCSVGPVDYYYIDFGLSMHYPKGRDTALTTGTLRNFRTIPELSETVPYNPFKVDVFQLGLTMANVIKEYPDLRIFSPVANRMMSTNPSDRPEPAQSLQEFNSIVARFSPKKLRSPILRKTGSGSTAVKAPEELLVTEDEVKWVEIQPFLLSAGYKLRSRYDPNWNCDVLDAIQIEDGKKVVMKWLAADSSEVQCIQYLSNISDPRNRTIPVLQILPLPNDIDVLVVMPHGRRFNHPAFHCRGEFAEAMRQFLEGLTFMHEHNVCHFDIAPQNLMMDESRVVPRGSHFRYPKTHDGYRGYFEWKNRCSVGPVDYYYIDFGLSMHYPKGRDTALTTGTLRNFRTIPELSETVSYNPFKVDVFQLGLTMANVIKDYPDLRIFSPVANRMMSTNPSDRPEPAQSLQEFNSIVARFSPKKLRSPILRRTGS
ncbi:hypothetical protein K438DRAFT_2006766, partial [Mycena galopus ATCC 62051]